MLPRVKSGRPAEKPVSPTGLGIGLDAAIEAVAALDITALRSRWLEVFGRAAPPTFSKDLLARGITHQMQSLKHGDISKASARYMRSLLQPGPPPSQQVKVGSVLVREHKGVLHEVLIVPGGFCWQGSVYDSLSTIARMITGVNWNGPRFFGLRSRKQSELDPASAGASAPPNRRGRRSSLRSGEVTG